MKKEKYKLPFYADLALTYKCQNRCEFCPAPELSLRKDYHEMTTEQVKKIIEKLFVSGIRTVIFTGGESSIRNDFIKLVHYSKVLGMTVKLVTNGIKFSAMSFARELYSAGVDSVQVSLHSHRELTHNIITGNMESYRKTLEGIHNLINAGIETTTRTIVTRSNLDHLAAFTDFLRDEFDAESAFMNMNVHSAPEKKDYISYTSLVPVLDGLFRHCRNNGMKLVWGSPFPYCILNLPDFVTGFMRCACISDTLSINPAGDITPCSGNSRSLGNLLDNAFDEIWNGKSASYFIKKKYLPPVCKKCTMKTLCIGACPVYWENTGTYSEIEKANGRNALFGNIIRSFNRRVRAGENLWKSIKVGN